MKKVNLVYTNGEKSFQVYWIKQCKEDIYHGFAMKDGQNFHWSHHRDGSVRVKAGSNYQPMYKGVKITDIDKMYSLGCVNVGDINYWAEKYYKPYKGNKLSNVIWVDTRLFPNDIQIQIELLLVRPEYISILNSEQFRKVSDKDYRLIQIVQDINPWLIVHIRNLKFLSETK